MTGTRPWSRRDAACRRCDGTGDPHNARGYCHPCYNVLYEAGELAGTWPARARVSITAGDPVKLGHDLAPVARSRRRSPVPKPGDVAGDDRWTQ